MEQTMTVLIADSTEDFCAALNAALQRTDGFQVIGTATDGEQAIRMITDRKPDILVLDLMLPKKDGLAILKTLAETDHHPIVLATSAFVSIVVPIVLIPATQTTAQSPAIHLFVLLILLSPFSVLFP